MGSIIPAILLRGSGTYGQALSGKTNKTSNNKKPQLSTLTFSIYSVVRFLPPWSRRATYPLDFPFTADVQQESSSVHFTASPLSAAAECWLFLPYSPHSGNGQPFWWLFQVSSLSSISFTQSCSPLDTSVLPLEPSLAWGYAKPPLVWRSLHKTSKCISKEAPASDCQMYLTSVKQSFSFEDSLQETVFKHKVRNDHILMATRTSRLRDRISIPNWYANIWILKILSSVLLHRKKLSFHPSWKLRVQDTERYKYILYMNTSNHATCVLSSDRLTDTTINFSNRSINHASWFNTFLQPRKNCIII